MALQQEQRISLVELVSLMIHVLFQKASCCYMLHGLGYCTLFLQKEITKYQTADTNSNSTKNVYDPLAICQLS